MIYRSFVFDFNASHKLSNPNWATQKNKEIFGVCSNINWHGHNFKLIITLSGLLNETGKLVDETLFREWVEEHIISDLHEKNLSFDSELLLGIPATCENIIQKIANHFEEHLHKTFPNLQVAHLKLYETKNNSVEFSPKGDIQNANLMI